MKRILPIFVFILIGISHLNIMDIFTSSRMGYNNGVAKTAKNNPLDEQSDNEKDSKEKEKSDEQQKFYAGTHNLIYSHPFAFSTRFFPYNTPLNIHPYQEDDILPPRAV